MGESDLDAVKCRRPCSKPREGQDEKKRRRGFAPNLWF